MEPKQFVPSKFCLSCDVCCRFSEADSAWSPALTDTDILKLPKELINQKNKFELKSYKDVYLCPCFRLEDNRCRVYQSRPFDCSLYPFLLVKKDNKFFLGVDLKCPFLQDKQNSHEFQGFVKYLLAFLGQEDIKELIKINPQIIGDYQEDVIFLQEINLS